MALPQNVGRGYLNSELPRGLFAGGTFCQFLFFTFALYPFHSQVRAKRTTKKLPKREPLFVTGLVFCYLADMEVVRIESYTEYQNWVIQAFPRPGALFRGHGDASWPLLSTIGRHLKHFEGLGKSKDDLLKEE